MRKPLTDCRRNTVGVFILLLLTFCALSVSGPNGPVARGLGSGGELETTPITDWTFVETVKEGPHEAGGYPLVQLQTRNGSSRCCPTRSTCRAWRGQEPLRRRPLRRWRRVSRWQTLEQEPRPRSPCSHQDRQQAVLKVLVRVTDPAEDAALVKAWNIRRTDDADPGMTQIWFRVMPDDAVVAN